MFDLTTLARQPWLMEPGHLQAMAQRLARVRDWPSADQVEASRLAAAKQLRQVSGKLAILPISGMIEHRFSPMSMLFGGTSTEMIEAAMQQIMDTREIGAVLLDVNSPGGESYGVEELSDFIHASRGKKPIYAISNSMMASAAYWIGSAADQVVATPGADTGSIGVYSVHLDLSKALEAQGIKATVVSQGKFKTEFSEFEPLSQEARAQLQDNVDETYNKFVKGVARNRGVSPSEVRDRYGRGRVLSSEKARDAGMVDKVMSFSELIGRLTGGNSGVGKSRLATAEMLRLRHEHSKRTFSAGQG